MLEIIIDTLWNGQSGSPQEHYVLTLQATLTGYHLHIKAPFFNDPKPDGPEGSFWQLWEHEVVELFIVGANGHYLELECGPHGHYLVLQLDGVRSVARHSLETAYTVELNDTSWSATLHIPQSWIPEGPHRLNAFAIHGLGAQRRYLAHTPLPGVTPDFHQPSQFRPSSLPNMG